MAAFREGLPPWPSTPGPFSQAWEKGSGRARTSEVVCGLRTPANFGRASPGPAEVSLDVSVLRPFGRTQSDPRLRRSTPGHQNRVQRTLDGPVRSVPRPSLGIWAPNLNRNVERDTTSLAALAAAGWAVLVFWECECRSPDSIGAQLRPFLVAAPGVPR